MTKKKVLYFMPDNPMIGQAGNLTKCRQMLTYFELNNQYLDVDFASLESGDVWTDSSQMAFKTQFPSLNLKLIDRKPKVRNLYNYLVKYKIPKLYKTTFFSDSYIDLANAYAIPQIKKLISERNYDFVIISYASWGNLIPKNGESYFILDTHDFMTLQYLVKDSKRLITPIGRVFEEEINVLKRFDEIWTYSIEEKYIFEQFSGKKIKLFPVSFPFGERFNTSLIKYDLTYVASDNPHNVKSIKWYLENVAPLLGDIKTYIIGKICNEIGHYPNVIKLGIVDDLDEIYKHTKITICPMLSGTGIKIKVLESLSYGIPVVTTPRGIDGLVNKSNNGCLVSDGANEFAENIINLIQNETLYNELSNEAISYFRQYHAPDLEMKFLNSIFLS